MRSKSGPQPSAEQHVREIRRQTRKRYSSEEKIRIVLEGRRGRRAFLSVIVSLLGVTMNRKVSLTQSAQSVL